MRSDFSLSNNCYSILLYCYSEQSEAQLSILERARLMMFLVQQLL